MRLRLSPPELGSLQMQISVKQGALTASIQADNSTAQQVLLDSLPDLRERLAQQDIRIERFDVQVAGQGSGGSSQSPQGNPDFNQTARRPSVPVGSTASAASAGDAQAAPTAAVLTSGALNVVV
jgi:flagellar hook-length control protein FliK